MQQGTPLSASSFRTMVLAVLVGLLLTMLAPARGLTISTTFDQLVVVWGPNSGGGGPGLYGQSFTVPVDAPVLESFDFTRVGTDIDFSSYPGFNYETYLFSFDPGTSTISGSALYTSPLRTLEQNSSSPDDNDINLQLNPGGTYLIFVSSAGIPQISQAGEAYMEGTETDEYSGGGFYYTSGDPLNTWTPLITRTPLDTAFTAVFEPVPETSTWVAPLFCLAALLLLRYHRGRERGNGDRSIFGFVLTIKPPSAFPHVGHHPRKIASGKSRNT